MTLFAIIRRVEAVLDLAPGELYGGLSEQARDECWRDLRASQDRYNRWLAYGASPRRSG
jgi:hypothetical protein